MKSISSPFALGACLATVVALASATCPATWQVCLKTFRPCISKEEKCHFPDVEHALPVPSSIFPYAILADNETYPITWEGTRPEDSIELEFVFPEYFGSQLLNYTNGFIYRIPIYANTSYTLNPPDFLTEIAASNKSNGSPIELQALAANLKLQFRLLVTRDHNVIATDYLASFYFSILPHQAAAVAAWQAEQAFDNERRKWRLGVGIGVGLGVPIAVIVTAMVTRWKMKSR